MEGEVFRDYQLDQSSLENKVHLLTGCFGGITTMSFQAVRWPLVHCCIYSIVTTEFQQVLKLSVCMTVAVY